MKSKRTSFISILPLVVIVVVTIGILLAISIPLISNHAHKISSGIVTDKSYVAAHQQVTYHQTYYKSHTTYPVITNYPESYKIQIQDNKNGKTIAYWFECDSEEYNNYKIGDKYPKEVRE